MPSWQSLESLFGELFFRLLNISGLESLDLLLVTLTFYLLFRLIQRSRVSLLVRGQLVLVVILFITTILLPLPTFDWLILGILIAMLVATPVIFQPELRRFLERIGRNAGLTWGVRQTAAENVIPKLVRAVENLAANYTGALIALEGKRILREIVETGVMIEGQMSSELLQAIFYPENPLHDGAVVLREDRVIAASCVLPLTQQALSTRRRLGTRHRAAVGLSEHSDAFIIVVSEETGTISLARDGHLRRPVDGATLREQLFEFFVPPQPARLPFSLRQLIPSAGRQIWSRLVRLGLWFRRPRLVIHNLLPQIGLFALSLLLALITWTFVIERTNPARQELFEDIPLQIENIPPGTTLPAAPPATVSIIAQTTNNLLPSLRSSNFQASISLAELSPGVHSVPVHVTTNIPRVWVLAVEPPVIDLELTPIVTKLMTVTVVVPDSDGLSLAYRLVGEPVAEPSQVQVIGAAPVVKQVSQVRAELFLGNTNATLTRTRPLQALDALGRVINGVSLEPNQVDVTVLIQRQLNARNVGVRPLTSGIPPEGYRLSSLTVSPNEVTLQGGLEQLNQGENFVDTLPVDISQATGDLTLQVPLALPPNVQALDSTGTPIRTVTVQAQVVPRNSYLLASRPVELLGISPSITATVNPTQVDLIISGPAPIISQIEQEPGLVKVLVDLVGVDPPQRLTRPLSVAAPDEIQVQVIPDSVQVTLLP